MKMRVLLAIPIALTVLFSQGGNYALAALCPHLKSIESDCATQTEHSSKSHDEITSVPVNRHSRATPTADTFDLVKEHGDCTHCVVHSRTRRDERAFRQATISQRVNDQIAAVIAFDLPSTAVMKTRSWAAKSHGPPGDNVPRHILLNIFRI